VRTGSALAILSALLGACAVGPAPSDVDRPTAIVGAPASTPSPASSAPAAAAPTPEPLTGELLARAVTARDMRVHLDELQAIANAHGGNRATGTPGFDASVAYVADRLELAGYDVHGQAFSTGDGSSVNLIVERAGSAGEIVMLGAHLDSVRAGPGINDNGSGVAALLVIAERLAELPAPEVAIRIAFWGAEEGGAHGSSAYVDALGAAERERIGAYLNFDMIGSDNASRFVYGEAGAAPGSEALTQLFASYFAGAGLAWEPVDLEGDSDHGPFIAAGIPTGGLFSGGIEPKTDAQAAVFGGTAGQPADACSHRACDTIDKVSETTLAEMADAIAHVLVALANP